jgi:hypothetical protein
LGQSSEQAEGKCQNLTAQKPEFDMTQAQQISNQIFASACHCLEIGNCVLYYLILSLN